MKELRIKAGDEGQRLNKFLMKYLNQAPSSFVYKMLRKKNIKLNDKKASGDEILVAGDLVCLYLADETIEKFRSINTKTSFAETKTDFDKTKDKVLPSELTVLYQTKDILAVHKPVGVLSQKAKDSDYSINETIVDYYRSNQLNPEDENHIFTPSVCNRLDRNTSGIILAGISLKGSQYLSRILKNRDGDKYYYSIVNGDFVKKRYEEAYICKDSQKNKSTILSRDSYQKLSNSEKREYSLIQTEFEPVSTKAGYTFLKIKLITGKSHQIRAHLAHLGYPILGDYKYGDVQMNKVLRERFHLKHHLLHAGLMILPDGTTITDPLPKQFTEICNYLGLS